MDADLCPDHGMTERTGPGQELRGGAARRTKIRQPENGTRE